MPEVKRVLMIGLNISLKGRITAVESQEKIRPLLQLTFYLLDKLRRFKLSKEVFFIDSFKLYTYYALRARATYTRARIPYLLYNSLL